MKYAALSISLAYLLLTLFLGGYPLNLFLSDWIFNSKLAVMLLIITILYVRGFFQPSWVTHIPEGLTLASILGVAAYLRFRDIPGAALMGPTVDEPILMLPVINMLKTGNLDFGTYEYGGVYFYVLVAVCAYYVLHVVSNFRYRRGDEIPSMEFYTAGRYATAIFSLVTVGVIYATARRFFGKWQAVVAASILAISFLHFSISDQIRIDLALALFVLTAHYFFLRIHEEPSLLNYLLAGLFCGLAIGTKYTVVPIFAPLILVHLLIAKRKWLNWNILAALAFACAVYFIFNLYAYLNFDQFMIRLPIAIHHNLNPGHWSHSANKPLEYTWILITQGVGAAGLISALITLRRIADPGHSRLLILWCFPIIYFAMVGSYRSGFDRYILPIVPNLAILAGEGAVMAYRWLTSKIGGAPERARAVAAAIAILLIAPQVWTIVQYYSDVNRGLKAHEVIAWVRSNLPHGSSIIADPTGPVIPENEFIVQTPDVSVFRNPRNLRDADYLVVTEDLFKRIPPRFEVIKEFPSRTRSNDRTIRVYKLRQ